MDNQNAVNLEHLIASIPENAKTSLIKEQLFPALLATLGFSDRESYPRYLTGQGNDSVDYAIRKNNESQDTFIENPCHPHLLVEIKGRDIKLEGESSQYRKAQSQLFRYMLAPRCKTVQWGILTNFNSIQLFRKHGKVIFPVTQSVQLTNQVVDLINKKIHQTSRALTVAVYNNKGGVGKTTTVLNLAALLSLKHKQVLVIDADPNQQDLTISLGFSPFKNELFQCLTNKKIQLEQLVKTKRVGSKQQKLQFSFDVLPADQSFLDQGDESLTQHINLPDLQQKLRPLYSKYDYILIDSSPNWRFVSQMSLYAADVVLIPTKHNNLFSLKNAATVISQFIPEIQALRRSGSPVALPIFFNGEQVTTSQEKMSQDAILKLIQEVKQVKKFDLTPYFYPKYTQTRKDLHIFTLPGHANIAKASFSTLPIVYRNKIAYEYYLDLAKEYFLQ